MKERRGGREGKKQGGREGKREGGVQLGLSLLKLKTEAGRRFPVWR